MHNSSREDGSKTPAPSRPTSPILPTSQMSKSKREVDRISIDRQAGRQARLLHSFTKITDRVTEIGSLRERKRERVDT